MASNIYLPGTPADWTGGLENVYYFNNLVLNDKTSNADRYKFTKIDGLYDAEVRDSREANPSRHGETAFQSYYGGKTITIEGVIQAGNLTKLRNMIFDLQRAFADLEEHTMWIYTYASYLTAHPKAFIVCKKAAPLVIEESNNSRRMERTFSITLKASDPFIYSANWTNAAIFPTKTSNWGRIYNSSYSRVYTSTSPSLDLAYVTNNGNTNFYPLISIIGPAKDITIVNYTTNNVVKINYDLASGRYLQYDTFNKTLIETTTNVSVISSLDISSDEFYIAPGVNSIGFGTSTYSDGVTELVFPVRDAYI